MTSEHYILKHHPEQFNKILDISEHMASAYGFEKKDLLMMRLLTEEAISAVQSALLLYNGEIWFGSHDGMFTITVSVNTDISGMPLEQRKQLKKMDTLQKKQGVLGLVKEYMDFLMSADEELTLHSYVGTHYNEYMNTYYPDAYDDVWNLNINTTKWYVPAQMRGESEIDLEISLLQGYADDIRVTNKRGFLEITVMKSIPALFMFNYLVTR